MLTDEDIDCFVQDITDTGGAPLGSIEKPSAIDAIQKHVEESLLFLDEEKSTLEKSEKTTKASHEKINIVLEKPGSDDTVMQDGDDSLRHIERDANDKNTGKPLKNSTVKQDNKNVASLSEEQQKDKSEIERVTTEIKEDSLVECVKERTSNIPEQMETNEDILSLKDNPITDSVLNEIDTDTAINGPQNETSGISEQTDTVKVVVQEDNPPSDCAVNEIYKGTIVNVVLKQNSEIPLLTDCKKAKIVSLEHNTASDTVLNEINKDTDIDNPQEVTCDITDKINTIKIIVSREIPLLTDGKKANIVSIEGNPTCDTMLNEINADEINNDSENKPNELSRQCNSNKVYSALQKGNPSSFSTLNETDTDAIIYDSELKSSDLSEQSAATKDCNTSHEDNPSYDNMLTDTNAEIVNVRENTSDISFVVHEGITRSDSSLDETDADVTMNYDSQEELGDNSKHITTTEKSKVSKEQKSPSVSMHNKTDLDANMDDTQEGISEIPQQKDEMNVNNVSQEENRSSEGVLDKTGADAAINDPQEETSDISEQMDISNIARDETDTDAAMNVSHEISEQIDVKKVDNIYQYKVLNETDTDVSINYSQEDISDISELIDSKEVSMVSQEDLPSDIVLSKTDTDASMNDEIDDMKTYNMDDSNISVENSGLLNSELDKTDAVLHEGYETGVSHDNLKSIKKADHENSVPEPQKDRILVESKETNYQTDQPTQSMENTTSEDKVHDKLPELETNVEKTGLTENETQVKEINETVQAKKSPVKELVWEIKSIKPETEQQEKKELLQKEGSQEQNVTENPSKKNPLLRAVPFEDVTECPPAKRSRFQPVWTTNALNDEDKPKPELATSSGITEMEVDKDNDTAAEVAPVNPYEMSQEVKKQLQTWLLKTRVAHPRAKYMLKLVNTARWNKAVLRMAPIPKDYKQMDVFRVIRNRTEAYEKEITKNIQYIHIHKHDDNFNAAYIKWRDIDKLLVVKAYQILVTTSFTVDGVVKQPLFKYDDRSLIDWTEKDRPILKLKDGTIVVPKNASAPALTPVVTPISTDAATSTATPVAKPVAAPVDEPVAKPAATPVVTPRPRKPPPSPFINGEINFKDRQCFGLSNAFMEYHNLKSPIVGVVFAWNLDVSQSIERYHRIFSAAGDIVDIEVMPPPDQDEQLSLKLRISFNHGLEAVQAVSMFHGQILYGRLIEVEMCHISIKKKPLAIEGFSAIGPGLGINGYIMRNIRSNIELSKLRAKTKIQFDNFKGQINTLRQKLSATNFKIEQMKRDEDKRRYKEEKKQIQSQNESQSKQSNMDAMSAIITKAIASSVQANVISMLGIQTVQQGQNIKQTPSATVNKQPSGVPQNQNTPRAPLNWTTNKNTATPLPNTGTALPSTATALPNTATPSPNIATPLPNTTTPLPNTTTPLPNIATPLPNIATPLPNIATPLPNPNMFGQTSMENAFQNLGRELQRYQNPQDPYSYYASMQQAYAQYAYNMDPTLMQAQAYFQPGTSYMQPAIANVQPVPPVDTSIMQPTTPKTLSMPKIISNQPAPSKPSNPTQSKVHTEAKTVFPHLQTTNKNVSVYEIQRPPLRFDKPPANVDNKTTARSRFDVPPAKVGQTTAAQCKGPEIPQPITTVLQPAVKVAFKIQKPIVPPKETKPAGINIRIPSVLPETVPLVEQNPRTLDKNSVQRKLIKLAEKMSPEPWINKHIRDMRRNSKSPERIRKSPEKIKSPDCSQKNLPKAILPSKAAKRLSRSPERRRTSRSPVRRNSKSPIRRRSRSTERRRLSRSPKRRMSRSPIRRRSRSPIRRRSRSTERRRRSRSTDRRRMSKSPKRRMSRSPIRRKSRSPKRRLSRSPVRRKSKSPIRRRSRSPKREINRSPKRRISKSPIRRKSRSPVRRISKSPVRKISRSPVRRYSRSPVRPHSRSPVRRISRSPVRRTSKSPVRISMPPSQRKGNTRSRSSELGTKPTPRPAYEPDGASRDITNLDLGDRTANYNYEMKWKEMERELSNTSVIFSFLPPSVNTEDLNDKMGEIGELLEVRAFGMGKALVVYKYRHDAETCIEMYNMAKVDGQTIEVRWASIE